MRIAGRDHPVDPAGNVLFLNVSTTVSLVDDADSDGNADAGDVLRFVTLVTNNRGVDLTNVSLMVDLADALRRMPGTVRIYEDASSSTYVEHDVPFSRATVFRNGSWFIDDNQNGYYDGGDTSYSFGQAGDLPVLGDWNGDGIDEIGVFRNGTWFLDVTGDGVYGEGDATIGGFLQPLRGRSEEGVRVPGALADSRPRAMGWFLFREQGRIGPWVRPPVADALGSPRIIRRTP